MFSYELIRLKDEWAVKQNILLSREQKINQTFSNLAYHYSCFEKMRYKHYTEKGYGPFLTGIRLNRWSSTSGFVLRDNLVWDETGRKKVCLSEAVDWLFDNFSFVADVLAPMLTTSWERLAIDANK